MKLQTYLETRIELLSELKNLWLQEFDRGEFYVLMEAGRLRAEIAELDSNHLENVTVSQEELNQ